MDNEENLLELSEDRKVITIKFEKIFNRDLSEYDSFKVTKRTYINNIDLIFEDIKDVVENSNSDYCYKLLSLKYNSLMDKNYNLEKFKRDIMSGFRKDTKLIDFINNKVEKNYTIDLNNEESKKRNVNLQVTNDLNKTYLKSIIAMRITIPALTLITNFTKENDDIIFDVFSSILLFFNKGDNEILKKLYNIASSRIKVTSYSHNVIWKFLLNMHIDPNLTILTMYHQIVIQLLIKIENNKSCISFIHVCLEKKIGYLFRFNYKYGFKMLDYESINDSLNDVEKIEINLIRKDKSISIINDLSIQQTLDQIYEEYDEKEIEDFCKKDLSPLVVPFLEIFYDDKFVLKPSQDIMKKLNFGMIKELEKNHFKILPIILQKKIQSIKINNKKKIIEKISKSKKYSYFLDKYSDIKELLKFNNFLFSLVYSVKTKKFLDEEENPLDIPTEKISEELIDFLFMFNN